MYDSIIVSDLATRDQYIDNINQQIKKKQSFLIDKSREIKKAVKNNKYLEIVKKEYDDYIYHLKDTKQKQLASFKTLLKHINKNKNLLEFQDEIIYKITQIEKEIKDLH
jgi:uncharacterized protein (DUF3084 family)